MPLDIVENEIPDSYMKADYSILMFVLSAIKPEKHELVIKKIHQVKHVKERLSTKEVFYISEIMLYMIMHKFVSHQGKRTKFKKICI